MAALRDDRYAAFLLPVQCAHQASRDAGHHPQTRKWGPGGSL